MKKPRGGRGSITPYKYYNDKDHYGGYQYITLSDIINNFTAVYVGSNKIFADLLDGDISYHAHRALQELSYDTLKSHKSQEITLPPSLQMVLPHDYVNYIKVAWSDDNGIEHIIYPTSKTSNANTIQQDEDGEYLYADAGDRKNAEPKLLQDHFEGRVGFKLRDNYGTDFSPGNYAISSEYSGPFRLERNFAAYIENDNGEVIVSNENIEEPVLKNGMKIDHISFQPNTKITNVSKVAGGLDQYFTEFYIDKPTYKNQGDSTLPSHQYVSFDDITSKSTWGKFKDSANNQVAIDQSTSSNPAVDNRHYFDHAGGRYGLDPQYAQGNGTYFIDHATGKIHISSKLSGKTIVLHYLSDHHGTDGEAVVHKFAEEAMYKWIAYGCAQARTDIPEGVIQRFKREKFVETRKAKIRLSNIKIEEISQVMRGKSKFIDH